jgi:hypothetical protein
VAQQRSASKLINPWKRVRAALRWRFFVAFFNQKLTQKRSVCGCFAGHVAQLVEKTRKATTETLKNDCGARFIFRWLLGNNFA